MRETIFIELIINNAYAYSKYYANVTRVQCYFHNNCVQTYFVERLCLHLCARLYFSTFFVVHRDDEHLRVVRSGRGGITIHNIVARNLHIFIDGAILNQITALRVLLFLIFA